ncbi:phosphonoacetate hydrolase [Rubritalea squalenifaciens DSM 18772]|uniref:Phosphonoacetate hydrolase n=1 Tax=Rubritalea squalenifaciens DSM 18772 TaxID=1123071 RepID=A0A1M6IL98_9BACT|nr:phnA protein [Rubritalea squalenifaciens]SHJ35153.1 phosphonoacetate hydrolase [Rubritalea squalenifaciens DSM 18772]
MAKGYDQHKERMETLNYFGKDLARRAKSKCELTGESNTPLVIYEVPPVPKDPDFDRCLMISENAAAQINNPKILVPDDWRYLRELIWSEQELVQIMACRILSYIAQSEPWAQSVLDDAYLDDSITDAAMANPIA